ncbi:transposase, Mutator family protein, partial [Mycobacterium ulcerans str. Harvey]
MLTDGCGSIEIDVPRDRAGTFEPKIVEKRQRRLTDVDEVVLSLYARGLTTGEISALSPTSTTRRCPRTPLAGSPTAF